MPMREDCRRKEAGNERDREVPRGDCQPDGQPSQHTPAHAWLVEEAQTEPQGKKAEEEPGAVGAHDAPELHWLREYDPDGGRN